MGKTKTEVASGLLAADMTAGARLTFDNASEVNSMSRCGAAVELAYIAAHRAGPLDKEIVPLSETELTSPIDFSQLSPDESGFGETHELSILGYEVLGEIACGGQATTYEAIQLVTGQHVALKVLTGGQFAAPRHRARFDQEAQLLVTCDHPNIVRIIDRGRTTDGSFFIATRFIAGESLDAYWAKCSGHSPEETRRLLQLFVKLLDALSEAHRNNVVHRDVKPSNIRVDQRGDPHVLDFGLARTLDDSENPLSAFRIKTMSGEIVGSLPWASPEQVSGQAVDARSDVYAVGVMLYQAMSGQFPYSANCTMRDLINQIVKTVPPPPCHHRTARKVERPHILDAIVMKALAKRPANRYANAQEMAKDLTCYLKNTLTRAKPLRHRHRNPVILAAAILCIGLAAYRGLPRSQPAPLNIVALPTCSNSIGMHFLRVPAGSFTMGSPPSEAGRKQDEAQHVVTLTHPFWLCTTEVTARQYAIVMGQPAPKRGNFELPVSDVSWDDSIEFCKILGAKEGVPYRLPTEAEWEYACRAGTIEPFSGTGDIHQFAWFKGKSGGHLHPVGSLQPNDFGLFDMHGGVAEWCSDGYEPFSDRPQIDPRGRDGSLVRIVRGGSFEQSAEDCRSASRQAFPRNYKAEDVGFRVIIDRLQTNPSF